MRVLGVNAIFHDPSAAVIVDGEIVAAAEEERFSRRKHGKRPVPFAAWELPELSMRWCLDRAGVRPEDLDAVAYSFDPALARPANDMGLSDPWDHLRLTYAEHAPKFLATALPGLDPDRVRFVPHHVAHAASAGLATPHRRCAVLVLDGRGERASHLAGRYVDGTLQILANQDLPHSLGLVYESLTEHLGFLRSSDEYKVMALASYGKPKFLEELRELIRADGSGGFVAQAPDWSRWAPARVDDGSWGGPHADLAGPFDLPLSRRAAQRTPRPLPCLPRVQLVEILCTEASELKMKTPVLAVVVAGLSASVMMGQLHNPNKQGNMAGHHIFGVKNVEEAKGFWRALGGQDVEWGVLKMVKVPGALLYINPLRAGATGGGTEGSSVDYLGFKVKDLKAALARIEPLGYKPMPGAKSNQAFVLGPDAVKVHLTEDAKLASAIEADEVHIVAPKGAKEWYEKYFGLDIGGARLTFTESKEAMAPTRGRALGTLGIEVRDLKATVAALKDSGATGITDVRDGGKNFPDPFAVAVFTDPWGTNIELSQGLTNVK